MYYGRPLLCASPIEGNVREDAMYGTQIHPTERRNYRGLSTSRGGIVHGTICSIAEGRSGNAGDDDSESEEDDDDDFQPDPEFVRIRCERIAQVTQGRRGTSTPRVVRPPLGL